MDRPGGFIHTEIPSLAVLFDPNQGTCLRAAANRYVAFVPAVKKSWGGQKIAHVSYGYNASLSAVGDVEQLFELPRISVTELKEGFASGCGLRRIVFELSEDWQNVHHALPREGPHVPRAQIGSMQDRR